MKIFKRTSRSCSFQKLHKEQISQNKMMRDLLNSLVSNIYCRNYTENKETESGHTWCCRCWLFVIGSGWLRVWIVLFLSETASLRIAELIKFIYVGAACWQVLLCSTVYPRLPSSFGLSITTAPYLHSAINQSKKRSEIKHLICICISRTHNLEIIDITPKKCPKQPKRKKDDSSFVS